MKKILALLLSFAILLGMCNIAEASEQVVLPEDIRFMAAVEKIRAELPNATIRTKDYTIHIVVNDYSEIPWFSFSNREENSRSTSVTSSTGGSFRDFDVPWYGYLSYVPFSQVYMKKDIVDALKIKLNEPSFAAWIMEQVGQGIAYATIVSLAYSIWGKNINTAIISILASFLYWASTNIEYWSLKNAQDNSVSGKVSVVKGTTVDGYYSYIYSSWNNNTCTTYGGYDATWYAGTYDV